MTRRAWAVATLLIVGLVAAPARAEPEAPNGVSLGVVLGDPTGLSVRLPLSERQALQAHLGFSPFPGDALVAMVDWTYEIADLLPVNETLALLLYLGGGVKAEWFLGGYYVYTFNGYGFPGRSYFGFGARGVGGLRAPFREVPIELFVEVSPVGFLVIVPSGRVYFDFDFATGVRYRF